MFILGIVTLLYIRTRHKGFLLLVVSWIINIISGITGIITYTIYWTMVTGTATQAEIGLFNSFNALIHLGFFLISIIFLLLGLLSLASDIQRIRPRRKIDSTNIAYSKEW